MPIEKSRLGRRKKGTRKKAKAGRTAARRRKSNSRKKSVTKASRAAGAKRALVKVAKTLKATKKGGGKSTRAKVAAYRTRLRSQGLRPIQIWVADTRARGFAAEAHRQSLLVAGSSHEAEDQAFLDALSEDS